jgi:hypothetical protein
VKSCATAAALSLIAALLLGCQSSNPPLKITDAAETVPSVGAENRQPAPEAPGTPVRVPQDSPRPAPSNNDAFAEIAKVLQHPRCLNCHVLGDTPKQGDDRHDHMPPVKRGPDGRGSGLTCNTCHQPLNGPVAPGAPDWHLAPLNMAWEGLSVGDLCRAVIDPVKNGGRDLDALAVHMTTDPLVQWGWNPGGTRKPVPISKEDFAQLVNAWVDRGGACPN